MDAAINNSNGWSQLQLRHLAALRAVAEHSSFGGAADELGYTQSAISHQIGALERIVGERLVERPGGRTPVSLTPAGELLLGHARAIVSRIDAARSELTAAALGARAVLRVGTFQSLGRLLLPELLSRLGDEWPLAEIELHECSSHDEPYDLLESGALDLAFSELPAPDGPFTTSELLSDPFVLLVAVDSELAAEERPLALAHIDGLSLIGFRECPLERQARAWLHTAGIDFRIGLRADENSTIQAVVATGERSALVPRMTVLGGDPGTEALELEGGLPPRRLAIAHHSSRSLTPVAERFVALARELSAPLGRELSMSASN